jgi:tetratricopeptide (TPR) repeat protein
MEGTAVTYRCARCGVESAERTCFVFPKRSHDPSRHIRCVQCAVTLGKSLVLGKIWTVLVTFLGPFIYLSMGGWDERSSVPVVVQILLGCLAYPVALVAHEGAHALTGYLTGLELGGIGFGFGRVVWRFELRGLPIRIHAWPLSGRVFLGSETLRWLRARVWITTLMGPATNVVLALVLAAWWKPLASGMGPPAAATWILVNAVIAFFNLLPSRGVDMGGSPYRSDGLALLQIPRVPESQLQIYLVSALLVRGLSRYELEDYAGAQAWLERARQRVSDNPNVNLALGTCKIQLEDYSGARALLEPVLECADLPVNIRASICNNIGYSLVMANAGELVDSEQAARADRLSAEAMTAFPCLLPFRNARALVLAATQRPEEALLLLEYVNYSRGTPAEVAVREVARAHALKKLGRAAEAEKAAALALRKHPDADSDLRHLGIDPPSEETQLRLLGKPVPGYVTWLRGIPSSVKEEARNASENLNQPQPFDMGQSVLLKIVGAILALIGGAATALLVSVVVKLLGRQISLDYGGLIFVAILFGVSAFCLSVGYRLVMNRPNRYGSLLSPGAWRVMSVCFAMLALFFEFLIFRAAPRAGSLGAGIALAPLMFAAWCWTAGRAARRNRA